MSSLFKIYSPEDCDFYYDGEYQGHISGNSDKAFRFEVERKGTYRVRFVNSRYKSELRKNLIIGVDEEQDIDLDFTEVNAAIIRAEEEKERQRRLEEEERKAAEEAERIRANEKIAKQHKIEEDRKIAFKKSTRAVGNYSEGLAPICRNDKYGFMDKTGKEVIPCIHEWAGKFSEGLASIKKKTNMDL